MQYDNNDMDKKLRQLENQSLPDLSKQDDHWRQMKTLLQPGTGTVTPINGKKYLRWMAAAIFLGGLSIVTYTLINSSKKQNTIVTTKPADEPVMINNDPKDTTPSNNGGIKNDNIVTDKPGRSATRKFDNQRTISIHDTTLTLTVTDDQPDLSANDPKASLAEFFRQMEKSSQAFVINSKRDTVITGRDGTALLIPANTFTGDGHVVLTLKEFYTYQDIITNKLTTSSNGEQLVTGGMIHLTATINGKQVNMDPGKSIRWFVPDTSSSFNQMQLFTGQTGPQPGNTTEIINDVFPAWDTVAAGTDSLELLNWVPDNRYFTSTYLQTDVKVLYLTDEPYKTRYTKKGRVGLFYIAEKPKLGREELATLLKEKYNYRKVKVKSYKSEYYFGIFKRRIRERPNSWARMGDSAWIDIKVAQRHNLRPTDTATYVKTSRWRPGGSYVKRTFSNINLSALANRFSVDIRNLGWINCDRFINDGRPRENYYVNIGEPAVNYYTVLAFDNIRSMIRGQATGNKVWFPGIPRGESATVICVGIRDGKTVAAMASLPERGTTLNLQFESTNPAAFKEQAATMDN